MVARLQLVQVDLVGGSRQAHQIRLRLGLPLARPHQMPLLDLVLQRGVGHAVVAASSMDRHLTPLDRLHRLHQAVAIVVPVFTPLGPGALARRQSSRLLGTQLLLLLLVVAEVAGMAGVMVLLRQEIGEAPKREVSVPPMILATEMLGFL